MATIKAVNGHAVLKVIEYEEQLAGNIIIPDMGKEKPEMAEVIAISNVYNFNKGEYVPSMLKVGMKVLIPKMGAQAITIEGEEYYITAQNSVLSIIE